MLLPDVASHLALSRRYRATFLLFFLPGLLMASWASRTPAIRDRLTVSTAEMGMVLPSLSVGSMCGVLCSGKLVQHFGTQTVIRNSTMLSVVNMLLMGFALCPGSPLLFAFGLAVFGSGPSSAEVEMNIEGLRWEKRW